MSSNLQRKHPIRNTRDRSILVYHSQLAKNGFDKIFDLTAGVNVYNNNDNILEVLYIGKKSRNGGRGKRDVCFGVTEMSHRR